MDPERSAAVAIRRARPRDTRDIAYLLIRALPESFVFLFGANARAALSAAMALIDAFCPDGERAFVAECDGRVVGLCLVDADQGLTGAAMVRQMWPLLRRLPVSSYPRLLLSALAKRRPEPGEAYVIALAVAEDMRGLGIGSRLLTRAESYARECHLPVISLRVSLRRPRLQALYERLGYRVVRVERSLLVRLMTGDPGMIYMVKPLAPGA